MKLTQLSRQKAMNFLKTGNLEGQKRQQADAINNSYSDRQLGRQMDEFIALDTERVRGDEDERWGHVKYRPNHSEQPVLVRVFGDKQEGGFIRTVERDDSVESTYTEFSRDSVRSVTVRESDEQTSFSAFHHDRNDAENGYLLTV